MVVKLSRVLGWSRSASPRMQGTSAQGRYSETVPSSRQAKCLHIKTRTRPHATDRSTLTQWQTCARAPSSSRGTHSCRLWTFSVSAWSLMRQSRSRICSICARRPQMARTREQTRTRRRWTGTWTTSTTSFSQWATSAKRTRRGPSRRWTRLQASRRQTPKRVDYSQTSKVHDLQPTEGSG